MDTFYNSPRFIEELKKNSDENGFVTVHSIFAPNSKRKVKFIEGEKAIRVNKHVFSLPYFFEVNVLVARKT